MMKRKPMSHNQQPSLIQMRSGSNRRQEQRTGRRLGLTFSGVHTGQMMMVDGHVLDLSRKGIGVHGKRSLKIGMELAIFIEFPDSEDHLCIPEARVVWVKGCRFGVALRTIRPEDQDRLCSFLRTDQQRRLVSQSENVDL